MSQVLGIVYRAIAAHLIRKAGLTHTRAQTGAVTLIQRFGSALNLNIHFHLLFLDGAYVTARDALRFRPVGAPTAAELQALVHRIGERVGRYLERQGLLVRDLESSHLSLDSPHPQHGCYASAGIGTAALTHSCCFRRHDVNEIVGAFRDVGRICSNSSEPAHPQPTTRIQAASDSKRTTVESGRKGRSSYTRSSV